MVQNTFEELRAFVKREAGIYLDASKEAMVRSRLEKRVRALGLSSVEAYLKNLKADDAKERIELLDVLTTNHTAFFRDPHHFDFLKKWLQGSLRRGQRKFRIWCAASSTGEEPYTLAMTLREAGIEDGACDAKILCTDLSVTVLRKASEGGFTADRLAELDGALKQRYFRQTAGPLGPMYTAGPSLQSLLHFNRLNLSQFPYPMQGPFDLIFCRNVFIYFQADLIRRILGEFERLMPEGGHLFVGSSESLTQHANLPFKSVGNSIYRKN